MGLDVKYQKIYLNHADNVNDINCLSPVNFLKYIPLITTSAQLHMKYIPSRVTAAAVVVNGVGVGSGIWLYVWNVGTEH